MGLCMYLDGIITFFDRGDAEDKSKPIGEIYRLGYWKNHFDLHDLIMENFSPCGDDGRKVDLSITDILQIIEAITDDEFSETDGSIRDESFDDAERKSQTLQILNEAIQWCQLALKNEIRSITYQGGW